MIYISLANVGNNTELDRVLCPICKKKICEKKKGVRVSAVRIEGNTPKGIGSIVIECHRCKSKYLIVTETNE